MKRQFLNETVLALSQLIPLFSQRNIYTAKLSMLVPFLTLKAGNYRLAQSNFAQANRLNEIVWGDSRPLFLSKESQHNHIINQHDKTSGATWSIASQDTHGMEKHQNEFEQIKQSSGTNLNSELEINPLDATHKLTNPANHKQTGARLDIDSGPNKFNQQTIINRSLSFRPILLQARQHSANSSLQQNSSPATKMTGMQLMGLLSGNNVSRRQPGVDFLSSETKKSNLSDDNSREIKPRASWSIPLAATHIDGSTSDARTLAQSNYSLVDSLNQSNITQQPDLIDAAMYPKRSRKSRGFDTSSDSGENFEFDEVQALPNLNQLLPDNIIYKNQAHNNLHGGSPENSNPLTEQIDKVVTKKLQAFKASDRQRNSDLKLIKKDIKNELAPEKLVSEEMIRVLLKKLRKQALEKRFRLGLLN